jgi:S1-C subfamily serine protease
MKRKLGQFIFLLCLGLLLSAFWWAPKLVDYVENLDFNNQEININNETAVNEPFNQYTSRSVVYVLVNHTSVELGTRKTSQGSGVVVDVDQEHFYVLTNFHLIDTDGGYSIDSVKVVDYLNNNYYAEIIITNQLEEIASETYDLALLKVPRIDTEINEAFKSRLQLTPGMIVHSIGYPGNERTFTSGKYLQLENSYGIPFQLISHDSYINKGSSGGALLDKNGDLLGINVRVLNDSTSDQFVKGYAIPLEKINEYLKMFNITMEVK